MKILITGGAGFIGSNLVKELLQENKVSKVRVLDNLSTGLIDNIEEFTKNPKFEFINGDIRDYDICLKSCQGMDLISHQAALGSVPRSINDPITTNDVNVGGTLNIFFAAKENKIQRIVYAASSSTYGDSKDLPKTENKIGRPLSPYAITKFVNELYADVFHKEYNMDFIGLRYFNVFGPKQNPNGPYAAVIPNFIISLLNEKSPIVNGDGKTSRDFTYIKNVVNANKLALFTINNKALNEVYNIACGSQTSLLNILEYLSEYMSSEIGPEFKDQRRGDIKHSLADISKAKELLGYEPLVSVKEGLLDTVNWYKDQFLKNKK